LVVGSKSSPYLLLSLAPLFWAGNVVIGRAMRDDIPPVAMNFWRWVIAGIILLPLALPELRTQWPVIRRNWRLLTVFGLIGIALFNTLSYIGLQWTTATNAALLNSTIPVMVAVASWLVLREPLSARQILGIGISLVGVLTILLQGSVARLLTLSFNQGDLILLLAMALWAFYTLLLRRKPEELSAVGFLGAMVYFGLPPLALAYAAELATGADFALVPSTAAALGYYGVFPSILAFLCFNHGVAAVGAARGSLFIHLFPVYTVVLSSAVLGESPRLYHFAGIALVLLGIWLTTAARRVPRAVAGEL
jgi:drug/metabolite transporter (DMT)-like permease